MLSMLRLGGDEWIWNYAPIDYAIASRIFNIKIWHIIYISVIYDHFTSPLIIIPPHPDVVLVMMLEC